MAVEQRITRRDAWWRHDQPQVGWIGATAAATTISHWPALAQPLALTIQVPPRPARWVWDTQPQTGWQSVLAPPFNAALYAGMAQLLSIGVPPLPRHARPWWAVGSPADQPLRQTFALTSLAQLVLDDLTVAFTAHVFALDAAPSWVDAAGMADSAAGRAIAYAPVLLAELLLYGRTFSTRALAARPDLELEIAALQAGGLGPLEQHLDELTDAVTINSASVQLLNQALLARTLSARNLLTTPVRLKLGFFEQSLADYLIIFSGVVDRFQATYQALTLALTDTTLQARVALAFPLERALFPMLPDANVGLVVPLLLGVHISTPVLEVGLGTYIVGIGADRLNVIRKNGLPVVPLTLGETLIGGQRVWVFTLVPTPDAIDTITADINQEAPLLTPEVEVPLVPPLDASNRLTNGGFETGGTVGWLTADGGVLEVGTGAGGGAGSNLVVNGDFATGDTGGWTPANGGSLLVGTGIAPELLLNGGFESGNGGGWTVQAGASAAYGTSGPTPPPGSTYRAEITGLAVGVSLGLQQDLTILEGHPHVVTGYVRNVNRTLAFPGDETITKVLAGYPGDPDSYGSFATSLVPHVGYFDWQSVELLVVPANHGATLRIACTSEYTGSPAISSFGDTFSCLRVAAGLGMPPGGVYRLELAGGDASYGDAYQEIAVEIGETYVVTALVYDMALPTLGQASVSQGQLLLGTPSTPAAYATVSAGGAANAWQPLTATLMATETTLRLTLQSQHAGPLGSIVPTLFTQITCAKTANALTRILPYEGTYRASLLGGLSADGQAYQDVTTVPGTRYTYALALWTVESLPTERSVGALAIGTTALPAAYVLLGNTITNAWQFHTGTFLAMEAVTRFTVRSQYLGAARPIYVDAGALRLTAAVTPLDLMPVLNHDAGENPVDAILAILHTYDGAAAIDTASFASARLATEGLLVVGRITAPTDSFTLCTRIARQTGMLLQKTRTGAYLLTVLDDMRPTALTFTPLNILDDLLVSSTPLDAVYTSVYLYFDTLKGGSTTIMDYAQAAWVTADDTSAVGGALDEAMTLCATARELLGRERRLEFFADLIRDPDTAYFLLAFLVNRYVTTYFTVQFRTWLDALPLRLADMIQVTHPLLLTPGASSRAEVLALSAEPSSMTVGITARVPSALFTLEAPPPVTRYMQGTAGGSAPGEVANILDLPGTAFIPHLVGATSLTVMLVVSHVTDAGGVLNLTQIGSTFFEGNFYPYTEAIGALLGDGTLSMTIGPGVTPAHGGYSSGTGWSCVTNLTGPTVTADFARASALDQTQLSLYCLTWDWQNHAMYVSGAITGRSAFLEEDLAFTTCTPGAGPGSPPTESIQHRPYFIGAVSGFDLAICRGLGARIYECLVIVSQRTQSIAEIVNNVHAPLLEYLSALYTPGVAVTVPLGVAPADYRLWYRDHYDPTENDNPVTQWHPTFPEDEAEGILVTLVGIGGGSSGIPIAKTAVGVTPPMMAGLALAPVT